MKPLSSQFLRSKGTCCKSNCLHCPYGTTLKNIGIKIEKKHTQANEIFKSLYLQDQFTSSLIGNAFGKTKSVEFDDKKYLVLSLKGIPCGMLEQDSGQFIGFKLLSDFEDQGITESYLRSLF